MILLLSNAGIPGVYRYVYVVYVVLGFQGFTTIVGLCGAGDTFIHAIH